MLVKVYAEVEIEIRVKSVFKNGKKVSGGNKRILLLPQNNSEMLLITKIVRNEEDYNDFAKEFAENVISNLRHKMLLKNIEHFGYDFNYNDENNCPCSIKFASLPDFKYKVVKFETVFDFEKGTAEEALKHMSLFELRDFLFAASSFENASERINDIWHNTL